MNYSEGTERPWHARPHGHHSLPHDQGPPGPRSTGGREHLTQPLGYSPAGHTHASHAAPSAEQYAAPGAAAGPPAGMYQARRPVAGIVFAVVAGVLHIPALVLLWSSVSAERVLASGVVAATLLLLGLPALACGLYALVAGTARIPEGQGARGLLHPPVSYLVLGIVLLLGAAVATG